MAEIALKSLADTERLGSWLGRNLSRYGNPPLFMRGEMGSGKTALTRFIVQAMPGADGAEFGSPSFAICNYYPVKPPALHCDLYRCKSDMPDDILDALDSDAVQVIVEWAEYFPPSLAPRSFLDINIFMDKNTRLPVFNAHGDPSVRMLEDLLAFWTNGDSR